jgi:hypothetical protein
LQPCVTPTRAHGEIRGSWFSLPSWSSVPWVGRGAEQGRGQTRRGSRCSPLVAPELTTPPVASQWTSLVPFTASGRKHRLGSRVSECSPLSTHQAIWEFQARRVALPQPQPLPVPPASPLHSKSLLRSTRLIKPRIRIGCLSRRTVSHSHLCKKKSVRWPRSIKHAYVRLINFHILQNTALSCPWLICLVLISVELEPYHYPSKHSVIKYAEGNDRCQA